MPKAAPTPDGSEIGPDFQRELDEELMTPTLRRHPRPSAPPTTPPNGIVAAFDGLWGWLAIAAGVPALALFDARGDAREVRRT